MNQEFLQKIIILAFYKFDKQNRLSWFTKNFCSYFKTEISAQTLLYEIARFRNIDPANNVEHISVEQEYSDVWKYYITDDRKEELRQIYQKFKKSEPIDAYVHQAFGGVMVYDHPVQVPAIIEVTELKVQRDDMVLERALNLVGHVCELNCTHELFFRKDGECYYTEGHHLIPLRYQNEFEYSLDVEANIVSLCPACHRLLHYGQGYENKIRELLKKRKNRLEQCNIRISEERLLEMYK